VGKGLCVWCVGAHEAQERTQAPLQTNLIAYSSHAEAPKEWFYYPNDAQPPPTPMEGTEPSLLSLSLVALNSHAHVADSVSWEQQSAWIVICMLWQLILTDKHRLWQAAAQTARCHVQAATTVQSLASCSAVSGL